MKVIIAGSRTFNDYELLKSYADYMLQNVKEVTIVSGGAKGADVLGEMYAREKGYPCVGFPAKWSTEGRTAGFLRNVRMAEYADALIAFWDGKSVGTEHMIHTAKQKGLKVAVKIWKGEHA